MRKLSLLLALLITTPVYAQSVVVVRPYTGANNTTSVSVGVASALALASNPNRVFLDIINQSATASVSCCFGTSCTAALNTAGSVQIPPLWHRSFEQSFVPSDEMNCIASAAATPVTIMVK